MPKTMPPIVTSALGDHSEWGFSAVLVPSDETLSSDTDHRKHETATAFDSGDMHIHHDLKGYSFREVHSSETPTFVYYCL